MDVDIVTMPIIPTDNKTIYDGLEPGVSRAVFWTIILKFYSIKAPNKNIHNNKFVNVYEVVKTLSHFKQYIFQVEYKKAYDELKASLFGNSKISTKEKNSLCNIIFMGELIYTEAKNDIKLYNIEKNKIKINYNEFFPQKYKIKLT